MATHLFSQGSKYRVTFYLSPNDTKTIEDIYIGEVVGTFAVFEHHSIQRVSITHSVLIPPIEEDTKDMSNIELVYTENVALYFLPAIFNGDRTGQDGIDDTLLDAWLEEQDTRLREQGYGCATYMEEEAGIEYREDRITGLDALCAEVQIWSQKLELDPAEVLAILEDDGFMFNCVARGCEKVVSGPEQSTVTQYTHWVTVSSPKVSYGFSVRTGAANPIGIMRDLLVSPAPYTEFCKACGQDEESREAMNTYDALKAREYALAQLFSKEQLSLLRNMRRG